MNKAKVPLWTMILLSAATCVCIDLFRHMLTLHMLIMNTAHCLDIIRQQLMCSVDIGVLGQVWVHPENPEPFVDFNTQHKCRNFEAIRQWAERNQLPETVPQDFLQPPKIEDRVYNEIPWWRCIRDVHIVAYCPNESDALMPMGWPLLLSWRSWLLLELIILGGLNSGHEWDNGKGFGQNV